MNLLLSTLVLFASWGSFAAETAPSESLKIKKLESEQEKSPVGGGAIQDMELKAEAGARSSWSMKATLGYSGPSLAEPFSDRRRNPDGRFTDVRTSVGGSMGLRYRLNETDAFNLGTGVSAVRPFHGIEQVDAEDPFISLDRATRWKGLQWFSRLSASVTTTEFYREIEQVGSSGISISARHFIPDSNWTVGFNTSLSLFFYERPYSEQNAHPGSDYFVGLYPSANYRVSDSWMITTSTALNAANRRREKDWAVWDTNEITQRLGVGWGVTREIYVSPYVNFFWKDPKWETSDFALSTVFSVF
jgi:hypothetical protein